MSLALAERAPETTELLDDDFASSPRFIHYADPGGVHAPTDTTPFGMLQMTERGGVDTAGFVEPSMDPSMPGTSFLSHSYYHYGSYCYCGD